MAKQKRVIETREALITAAGKVFARMYFEYARIADILEEASVTQGAFYFHFPEGKKQIAEVLIQRQDDKFIQLRDALAHSGLDGLSGVLAFSDALGKALQSDPVAQAGIRLPPSSPMSRDCLTRHSLMRSAPSCTVRRERGIFARVSTSAASVDTAPVP